MGDKVIQHQVICIGVGWEATNKHWALAGLHNSKLNDSGHINPSISANAATKQMWEESQAQSMKDMEPQVQCYYIVSWCNS